MPLTKTGKSWYASKAVWAGALAVLLAAYNEASASFGLPPVPDFVYAVLGVFGIYGRAAATEKLGK